MSKLEFEVRLRPDVRLLIDRVDESIEQEVYELNQRIEKFIKNLDYDDTCLMLVEDMDDVLEQIVPSRFGVVELTDCNVGIRPSNTELSITGFVGFDTPQYIGKTGNTVDVSAETVRVLSQWYMTWLMNHEFVEDILNEKHSFGFSLMVGFQDIDSEATITHGVQL